MPDEGEEEKVLFENLLDEKDLDRLSVPASKLDVTLLALHINAAFSMMLSASLSLALDDKDKTKESLLKAVKEMKSLAAFTTKLAKGDETDENR